MFKELKLNVVLEEKVGSDQWIAVGDIHASIKPLKEILRQTIEFANHKLIFLGDYFDYGENLPEVLDSLIERESRSVFLYGNHEFEFLNFLNKHGNTSLTRKQIINHFGISEFHVNWLKNNLKFYYQITSAFFSHSGIDDRYELHRQSKHSLLYSSYRGDLGHVTNKLVVQGHIPTKEVKHVGNHWFLDSGCGIGGRLSALVFPEMKVLIS
ncbi:metallophosphoesterase [Leptospira levettii]|uniref:metallophosphoesterase n=1 Tax=Leptospira levettii TaxID=2023178 RepID=UPI0038F72897